MYRISRSIHEIDDFTSSMDMHNLLLPIMPIYIRPHNTALLNAKLMLFLHFGHSKSEGRTVQERYDINNLKRDFLEWAQVFLFLAPEDEPSKESEMVGDVYLLLARLISTKTNAQLFVDCNNWAVQAWWEQLNKHRVMHSPKLSSP